MKKVSLLIAGAMLSAVAAQEASAVPVFARQTGMACNACHFQHFPLLNGFGRSFKAAGYTMVGSQTQIEGDNIALPGTLNMGVLTTVAYDKTSDTDTGGTTTDQHTWNVPGGGGELSLFFGGKINDHAGFLTETGLGSAAATNAAKLVNMYDVGAAKVGLVVQQSGGQGAAYSFELLNTGAVNTHKMTALNGSLSAAAVHNAGAEHVSVYSASQYLGTGTASTGIHLVASNDMGYINIGKWEMAGNTSANQLPLTYLRGVVMFDLAGFEAAAGVQNFGGNSNLGASKAAPNATIVDFQLQGEVGEKSVGIYVSTGSAPVATTDQLARGEHNPMNTGTATRSSFNIGATVEVMPRVALQAAYRNGKSGTEDAALNNLTDNAMEVGASYQLSQNQELSLTYTTQSGTLYDNANNGGVAPAGKSVMSVLLETLF